MTCWKEPRQYNHDSTESFIFHIVDFLNRVRNTKLMLQFDNELFPSNTPEKKISHIECHNILLQFDVIYHK